MKCIKYVLENDINIYSGADSQRRSGVLEAGTVVRYDDTPISESGKVEIVINPDKPLSEGEHQKVAYCNYDDLKVLTVSDETCVEVSEEVSQNDEEVNETKLEDQHDDTDELEEISKSDDTSSNLQITTVNYEGTLYSTGDEVKIKKNCNFDFNGKRLLSSVRGSFLYIVGFSSLGYGALLSNVKEEEPVCEVKVSDLLK